MVAETDQPTDEPSEGIDTSPSTSRPWVLRMHEQHTAYYVHIMVESGMSLPMGEAQSVPLLTEVLSLFPPYSLLIPSCISLLVLLCAAIHSFITAFLFTQGLQKIRIANHIHSLAELLHADAIQQLEVALQGSPATKLLNVLSMSTQHQAAPLQSTTVPPHPLAASSISPSPPSVPIMGVTDTAGPTDAKAN